MNIALDIDPDLIQVLTSIAHDDAICSEFPLAPHVRQRLKARAELRWVQAVARREAIPLNGQEIVQALEMKRPPPRAKAASVSVRRLGELHRAVRTLGGWSHSESVGTEHLENFHSLMVPDPLAAARYRAVSRRPFFLAGVPEFVPKSEIPRAVARVFEWLSKTPLGRSDVLGVALAHQELMLLTPFSEFTPAVVDAITGTLLMRRLVNRHGLAVLEQHFAGEMHEYEFLLQDRSDGGRARWARYFADKLAAALRQAAREVLQLRQHLEREPWLDAAPLTEREQLAYDHLLRARKLTSRQIQTVLGTKASTLRMVQRDLTRLAELGLIEKIGGRKDAYYRPLENLDDEAAPRGPAT